MEILLNSIIKVERLGWSPPLTAFNNETNLGVFVGASAVGILLFLTIDLIESWQFWDRLDL